MQKRMTRITRRWLRDQRACYTDLQIEELVPAGGLTLSEVLDLPIPAPDRVWVATRPRAHTPQQHATFARGCADRARLYDPDAVDADDAADAAYYRDADSAASAAAYWAADAATAAYYAAYRVADDAGAAYRAADDERQAQIAHLKILATQES